MTARPRELRRIALSSLAGTTVEYYDFMLYATMTALVFDRLFFPGSDRSTAAVAAFGTWPATSPGWLGRPAGYVARLVSGVMDRPKAFYPNWFYFLVEVVLVLALWWAAT